MFDSTSIDGIPITKGFRGRAQTLMIGGGPKQHGSEEKNVRCVRGNEFIPFTPPPNSTSDKESTHQPLISLFSNSHQVPPPSSSPPPPPNSNILGFICYIKAFHTKLLVLNCFSQDDIECILTRHPITASPRERGGATDWVWMVEPGCVAFLLKTTSTRPNQRIYCMEYPGPGCTSSDLGFVESLKTSVRLSTATSPQLFPLPFAVQQQNTGMMAMKMPDSGSGNSVRIIKGLTRLVWKQQQQQQKDAGNGSDSGAWVEEQNGDCASTEPKTMKNVVDVVVDEERKHILDLATTNDDVRQDMRRVQDLLCATDTNEGSIVGNKGMTAASNKGAAAALQARLRGGGGGTEDTTTRTNNTQEALPYIQFLGTGSAEPSRHRGASAILIRIDAHHTMLLDCGEGCWGQIIRLYGYEGAITILQSLRVIWVSHRHADHMAGVVQILLQYNRYKYADDKDNKLILIGPSALDAWLQEGAAVTASPSLHTFVHAPQVNAWMTTNQAVPLREVFDSIVSVPVRHCTDAYGVVLTLHRSGHRLVYSGDTQPSDLLVRAGTGASLLIHEATFEPGLVAEARKKRHSTTAEAVAVAKRMRAQCTMLTHFSQRYPKYPEGVEGGVGVAFDGMLVPLSMLSSWHIIAVCIETALKALEREKQQMLT